MVELPPEFINSFKAETIVTTPLVNHVATVTADVSKQDLTNFLLAIPFAADSIHMEWLTRTGNDTTWITNGFEQIQPFHADNDPSSNCQNVLAPRLIVFSCVCDWNLIMTVDNHPYSRQSYATGVTFNI